MRARLEQPHHLPEGYGDEQADDGDDGVEDAVFGKFGILRHLSVDTVESRQVHGILILHEPDVDDRVACHADDPGIDAERNRESAAIAAEREAIEAAEEIDQE